MATITTRSGKGSPLTNNEVDGNFTNLNTDKIELTDLSVTTGSASGSGSLSYSNSTGTFTFAPADLSSYISDLSSFTTTNLTEGTNLYYTDERVDDRVNSLVQAGSGISLTYDDSNNELTIDSDHIEYDATNNTGSSIAVGTPVYQTGASGNTITIAPADANGSGTMPAIGLTSETIANGATGKVTFLGIVRGFDTSSFSAGDTLFISETTGALTATRPVASGSSVQNFARVISSHASNGSVVVMGAGRSNDVPNLANKYVFIGNGTDAYEKRQLTSDDATEGSTNLFYTDARAQAAISVTDAGGDGSLSYSSGVITYTGPSATEVRAHFSAGTGVSITSGSIAIGQAVGTSDNVTFGDVIVSGDLTVNGTTTTVNSTTVTVDDPIFTLGGDTAPASDDNKDRGIEFRWHNGSAAKVGFFGYDDSASAFTFVPDATNSSEVFSGAAGDVVFGGATVSGITLGATAITATGAEINYLSGVSGAIQTQLDAKVETLSDLSITATATEINYTSGVTSAIQTQLDGKEPADATILKDADIGSTVQGYDANTVIDANLGSFASTFTVPTSDGTSGQALITDGAGNIAFGNVDALPSQTGNSGYYLTTDGSTASWAEVASVVYTRSNFTATAAQTTFSVTYDVGYVDVFMNGIKLISGTDFTATNGTSVVLASGATSGDLIETIAYNVIGISDTYTQSAADAKFAQVANNLSDLGSAATALTNLGLTATAAEINTLDGITATTTELNYLDITTLGTTEASKAVTADANGVVTFDNGKIEESTAITSSSGAATFNLRDGDNFTHTLSENVTYTFSNPAASGKVSAFTLKVTQDSTARTITWPSSVDWAAATAPTLTATSGGVDVFVFVTYDGGTTYYGFTAGQAMG